MWSCRELMESIELKAQECGVKAFEVVEHDTSKYYTCYGGEVEWCPRRVVSSSLELKLYFGPDGALNILKNATNSVVSTVKKPIFFLVGHNGVATISGCDP